MEGFDDRIKQYEELTDDYRSRIDSKYMKHMNDIKDQVGAIKKDSVERERRLLLKVAHGNSGRSVINKGAINMEDVKKANRNFTQLMNEFRKMMSKTDSSRIELLLEKEKLELQRQFDQKIHQLELQTIMKIESIKHDHTGEIIKMKEKLKRLEIGRQENLSIILQKESSIRLLQERIKADENNKDAQIGHSQMLVGFSNQLVTMLNEVRNGVDEMREMNIGDRIRHDYQSDERQSRGEAGSSISKNIKNAIQNSENVE